jgi:hypothetical protein
MADKDHPTVPLRRLISSLRSSGWAAPELHILMVLLIGFAVLSTRIGVLPGGGFHLLGDLAAAISWACLYVGGGAVYRLASVDDGRSARETLRSLGICLVSAIAAMHVLMYLLGPSAWDKFFYLRYLSLPVFMGFWCAVLLPVKTWEIYRLAKTTRTTSALLSMAVLLAGAISLVSLSDLALEFGVLPGSELQQEVIMKRAWVTNILILFGAYSLAFAVTSRAATALLFVSPFYIVLGFATLAKLKYMHTAVSPLDLFSVSEFLPLFRSFFGTGVLVATIVAILAWAILLVVLRRVSPSRMPVAFRIAVTVFSVAVLMAVPAIYYFYPPGFENSNAELYRMIGAPKLSLTKDSTRESGFLVTFLAQIPSSFVYSPRNYSEKTIADESRRYRCPTIEPTENQRGRRVNLVLCMIESFMDPKDLGLRYTADPIPNIRTIQKTGISGYGIVPGDFGGSVNTEFEALTGMSQSFLPERSITYKQFLRRPIPSLPRALKDRGYRTTAIQADPRSWFSRERAYDLLGFDETVWLFEDAKVGRATRGWWPSDIEVAEAIIRASRKTRPFFIFAFPSGTHSSYDGKVYGNSNLDILDPLPGDAAGEVKGYINALRDADRAIGRLMEHFGSLQDPTMIVIVGDHMPPLTGEALRRFHEGISGLPKPDRSMAIRRVPLLIWTNFGLSREEIALSTNALPSYLLRKMNISPEGFLAMTDEVRLSVPILTNRDQGGEDSGGSRDPLSGEIRELMDRYRLVQYDLLLGKQHFLKD